MHQRGGFAPPEGPGGEQASPPARAFVLCPRRTEAAIPTSSTAGLIDTGAAEIDFSGVVAVDAPGDATVRAFGLANRSDGIPNGPDTRFQIASGCKIFTSLAVCRLVEHGRLSFDTPLHEVLPGMFPAFSPKVTVHHLLSHTSGIPDYFCEEEEDDFEGLWKRVPTYSILSGADFLPLFQNLAMRFEPGARFSYNNAGFIVLGLIVEAITGRKFSEVIQDAVFGPAGMADSGYFHLDRLPERTARAYIEAGDGSWRENYPAVPIVGGADGGAFTTAGDMRKFWAALFGYRLLKSETTTTLLEPHAVSNEKPATHYGYGIWIVQGGDPPRYYVCGGDPGVSFVSSQFGDTGITILANATRRIWAFHDRIAASLTGN